MSGLTDAAGTCAAGLPNAILDHPFGEETDVYKVDGRIFVVIGASGITLKAEPAIVDTLVETEAAIDRGYHMNKQHWLTVDPSVEVDQALVLGLIEDAHGLVTG